MVRFFFCLVALVASSTVGFAAPLSSVSRVGPIVIGMTPAQAARTGTQFSSTSPSQGSTCYYVRPVEPSGLRFMVEQGTLRRAEVTSSSLRTTDGFAVGDTLAHLQNSYGSRATLAPDKYDPQAQTLTVVRSGSAADKYRLVYAVKNGKVIEIFAGALPQVLYVEGCS